MARIKLNRKSFIYEGFRFKIKGLDPRVFELAAKLVLKRKRNLYGCYYYIGGCDALTEAKQILGVESAGDYASFLGVLFKPTMNEFATLLSNNQFEPDEYGRAYFWGVRIHKNQIVRANALLLAAQYLRSLK